MTPQEIDPADVIASLQGQVANLSLELAKREALVRTLHRQQVEQKQVIDDLSRHMKKENDSDGEEGREEATGDSATAKPSDSASRGVSTKRNGHRPAHTQEVIEASAKR